ncbi:hypothetical protein B0G84_3261 [Paraburkholderia sp. BL8N3]|nr:hypothetical protein B0G84_3261 [Paraburkholderia sp. BL8N3]
MKPHAEVTAISLGLLTIVAGCQMHTPPHASAWQPVCLVLCFMHVEASGQSVSTMHRDSPSSRPKALAPSPASAAPEGSGP